MLRQNLQRNIKKQRLAQGLTQEDLAKLSGLSKQHISNIESRKSTNITVSSIESVAKGLKLPVSVLLEGLNIPEIDHKDKILTAIKLLQEAVS